jgi:hypothetical protein
MKERFALDGGYMARVLNPGSLLEKLSPVLVSRAQRSGVSGRYMSTLGQKIDLKTGRVSRSSGNSDISFNKTPTAVRLLLGVVRPEDIPGIRWSDKKPWLPNLFPQLSYHTSAWDEV